MENNINECIDYVKKQSVFFYSIASDSQKVYDEINKLKDSSKFDKLLEYYKNSNGPLNILRWIVLEKIKEGIYITENIVQEIKDKFNNKDLSYFSKYINENILHNIEKYETKKGGDPFRIWKDPFKIFYTYFFNNYVKEQTKKCLEIIGEKLIKDLNILNYKARIVTFDGCQNQGQSVCWVSLFPKELKSYNNAFQLFFEVLNNKLFAGTYKGHEVDESKEFERYKNEYLSYDEMLKALKVYAPKIIDLNNNLITNINRKQYWIYAPGAHAEKWNEYYTRNIMGIGWGFVGDITKFNCREEIETILENGIEKSKSGSHNNITKCLWDFANEMKIGDIVFVKKGIESIIGRGIVEGNYKYDTEVKDSFNHIREIKWTHNCEYECEKEDKLVNKKTLTNITNSMETIEKLEGFFDVEKQMKDISDYKQGDKGNQSLNKILYGPPGTGKTYKVINDYKDAEVEFITFHQLYSYEEFIEGIKPVINNDSKEIKYEIKNGIFKQLCIKANSNPNNKYVLIIDEINRGNISKIFGELITLIEDNKRVNSNGKNKIDDKDINLDDSSKNENSIVVTLPCSQKKFGIPKNLYIIGTMNTSDRSIASVDIALRRRFKFIEMMPQSKLVTDIDIKETKFTKIFEALNEKITLLLDRDHQIGHSYFMKDKINDDIYKLRDVWFDEILPLLNEYFYNDWEKLQALLGEASDTNDSFIITNKTNLPFYNYDIEDKIYNFAKKEYMNEENFKSALLKIIKAPKKKENNNETQETNN